MNPYQYRTSCSICGGTGVAHVRHTGADWLGATMTHADPEICRANLASDREKTAARIKELESKQTAWPQAE